MNEWIKKTFIYAAFAVPVGAIIGVLEAGFGNALYLINDFRATNRVFLVPFLAVAGLLIVFLFKKIGKESSKGMALAFDAWRNEDGKIPLRLIPLIIGTTLLSHLFGGSCGREGVAVQIGAATAHNAGRILKDKDAPRILMVAGMAAGFAGLFRTPITAIAFAMEMLVIGELRYEALVPAVSAAYTSYFVSGRLGIYRESFDITFNLAPDYLGIIKLLAIAILFGIVGGLFSFVLEKGSEAFKKIVPNDYIRIVLAGIVISICMLFIFEGRYMGTGANLVADVFERGGAKSIDWLLKLLLTALTLAAGFKGGEVAPLFAIGATFGAFIAPVFGLPVIPIAALGYAAVFGSGTGTILAPIFVFGEIFGWEHLPLAILVCLTARFVNQWFTIYPKQRKAYIK